MNFKLNKTCFLVSLVFILMFSLPAFAATTVSGHAYKSGASVHSGITVTLDDALTLPSLGFWAVLLLLIGSSYLLYKTDKRSASVAIGILSVVITAGYIQAVVVHTTTTNDSGYYEFTNVAPGSYIVQASAPGYESDDYQPLEVGTTPVSPPDLTIQEVCPSGCTIACPDPDFNAAFGTGLSYYGDWMLVGSVYKDFDVDGNSIYNQMGAVYVYKQTGASWNLQQTLLPSDPSIFKWFGAYTDMAGSVAVVGAPARHSGTAFGDGGVYVFEESGGTWTETTILTGDLNYTGAFFGNAVAVSDNYIMVGAFQQDNSNYGEGALFIFNKTGGTWTNTQYIRMPGTDDSLAFATDIDIEDDRALVSAAGYGDTDGIDSGGVYVYKLDGSSWAQEALLTPTDTYQSGYFGMSVDMDGNYAIIGALYADGNFTDSGAAYIFKRNGTSWSEEAKLIASDGKFHDHFGWDVALEDDLAIVGAYYHDGVGEDCGAVYAFRRSGTTWSQIQKFEPSDPAAGDRLGSSIILKNSVAYMGAYFDDDAEVNEGSVRIYGITD